MVEKITAKIGGMFSPKNGFGTDFCKYGYGNALQAASYRDYEKIVQLLLHAEANVNIQKRFYENALQTASYCDYEKIVQLLLNTKTNVNVQKKHH